MKGLVTSKFGSEENYNKITKIKGKIEEKKQKISEQRRKKKEK